MKKVSSFLKNSVYIIYSVMFLLILLINWFANKEKAYLQVNVSISNGILIILGLLVFLAPIYLIQKYKSDLLNRINIIKVLVVLSLLLLIIQSFIIYNIYFKTGWDASLVSGVAKNYTNTGQIDAGYFQRFPNNLFILFILTMLEKIALLFSINGDVFIAGICIVMGNLSVLLSSLIVYKLTNSKKATLFSFFVASLLFGLSPWFCIPYTDSFSILIPILTLFIYVYTKDIQIPTFVRWLLITIIPLVGYLIKPQNIIVLIAIIMVEIIGFIKDRFNGKSLLYMALALMISGVSMVTIKGIAQNYFGITRNEEVEFTLTHFAMMGLNERTNGVFADEDVAFTANIVGIEEKQKKNIEEIKNRLQDMGIGRLTHHLINKTLANYNDGTFSWGVEGNFYMQRFDNKIPVVSSFLKDIYYNDGSLYPLFMNGQQSIWQVSLIFCFLAGLLKKRIIDGDAEMIMMLSIIGITVFLTIFEARARYLFLYAPFFVVLATIGLYKFIHKIKFLKGVESNG